MHEFKNIVKLLKIIFFNTKYNILIEDNLLEFFILNVVTLTIVQYLRVCKA